jgi:hypothetical protein
VDAHTNLELAHTVHDMSILAEIHLEKLADMTANSVDLVVVAVIAGSDAFASPAIAD